MDERLKESLSALMDDEANELELERLLSRIGDDQELRRTWVRYQAVRSIAGGQSMAHLDVDISAGVRDAVAACGAAASPRQDAVDERLKQSLSALMDDEADELEVERLLSRIGDDRELRRTWVRYQAARSVAGGQSVADLDVDISAGVRQALATQSSAAADSLRERLWKPVASFAVAASVAAVVVLGGQQLAQVGDGSPNAIATPVGIGNIAGATPVNASYGTLALPQLQPTSHTAYRELARQRMQRYIQEHAEHAALNTPQGLIPFARVPEISN